MTAKILHLPKAGNVLYYHRKPLTDADRRMIALAEATKLHAKSNVMVALYKARELLREIADVAGDL